MNATTGTTASTATIEYKLAPREVDLGQSRYPVDGVAVRSFSFYEFCVWELATGEWVVAERLGDWPVGEVRGATRIEAIGKWLALLDESYRTDLDE